jgi:hypothetical protein
MPVSMEICIRASSPETLPNGPGSSSGPAIKAEFCPVIDASVMLPEQFVTADRDRAARRLGPRRRRAPARRTLAAAQPGGTAQVFPEGLRLVDLERTDWMGVGLVT